MLAACRGAPAAAGSRRRERIEARLLDEAPRVAPPRVIVASGRAVEQQEVERHGESCARRARAPREVEIVEVEAVVAIGVEAVDFPDVPANGDEDAIEHADAIADGC